MPRITEELQKDADEASKHLLDKDSHLIAELSAKMKEEVKLNKQLTQRSRVLQSRIIGMKKRIKSHT